MNATIHEWLDPIRQELNLKELAMDASSCGITIADIRQPDQPLIYVNDAFITITGYSREEVLHRNCRFLQGMNRDQTGVDKIRRAIREGAHCTVLLRNYRKDGTPFWNDFGGFSYKHHFVSAIEAHIGNRIVLGHLQVNQLQERQL